MKQKRKRNSTMARLNLTDALTNEPADTDNTNNTNINLANTNTSSASRRMSFPCGTNLLATEMTAGNNNNNRARGTPGGFTTPPCQQTQTPVTLTPNVNTNTQTTSCYPPSQAMDPSSGPVWNSAWEQTLPWLPNAQKPSM